MSFKANFKELPTEACLERPMQQPVAALQKKEEPAAEMKRQNTINDYANNFRDSTMVEYFSGKWKS